MARCRHCYAYADTRRPARERHADDAVIYAAATTLRYAATRWLMSVRATPFDMSFQRARAATLILRRHA